MALAMRVVSLGHAARNSAGIKLRQPLSRAVVALRSPQEEAHCCGCRRGDGGAQRQGHRGGGVGGGAGVLPVQSCRRSRSQYGRLFPAIRSVVAGSPTPRRRRLKRGQPLVIEVQGQQVELEPDEVEVIMEPAAGSRWRQRPATLWAWTPRSPRTAPGGPGAEVVRRVQNMRKDAGFRIEDYIVTYYRAGEGWRPSLSSTGPHIQQETLSQGLEPGTGPRVRTGRASL